MTGLEQLPDICKKFSFKCDECKEFTPVCSEPASELIRNARHDLFDGKKENAIASFCRAGENATNEKDEASALAWLGYSIHKTIDSYSQDARELLRSSLALDPENPVARVFYAEWLTDNNIIEEALDHMDEAEKNIDGLFKDMDPGSFFKFKSEILLKGGYVQPALEAAEKARLRKVYVVVNSKPDMAQAIP